MTDLLSTVKQAAMAAIAASNPVTMMYGVVTNTNPLEVNVDQRFTLPVDFLVVPESLTENKLVIGGTSYIVREGLKVGDKLLLLRVQGGQQFIILDRVVSP
ncbi:DUF2577 domain-containing protein [Paenibacillus endoradicis]|uniref:DUF2577 domain-containing protein n=1 Tax=Paenibacillus endoradicis TaxID=2972487 RepID=UPI002159260A|nr:DUF2577 domain-containing protein [Paenibacillus endoradicis]MCR8658965.1 DUF2577 domain-containing protein [Paenibacillus endoradicis]